MKNKSILKIFFVIVVSCIANFLHADDGFKVTTETAADEQSVVIKMVVYEEIEETNRVGNKITRRVDVSSVVPGDNLVYVTTVSNRSQQVVENVAIVNPVPEHTTYIEPKKIS